MLTIIWHPCDSSPGLAARALAVFDIKLRERTLAPGADNNLLPAAAHRLQRHGIAVEEHSHNHRSA